MPDTFKPKENNVENKTPYFEKEDPGISSPQFDGKTNVKGYKKVVGDVEENYSLIQQNQDNINLRVEKDDVINQINISDEGILIDGSNIEIDGTTTFSSGYDPSQKLDSSDVGNLAFEDLVEEAQLGTTIIDGGYIKTDLLTADNIKTGTLEGITVKQDNGSGESITLKEDFGIPTIELESSGNIVGKLQSTYQFQTGPFSYNYSGLQISDDLVVQGSISCNNYLRTNDLSVRNGIFCTGPLSLDSNPIYSCSSLDMDGDIDLRDYDINNVDNLYIQDIYGNGVSTIDIYEDIDLNGNDVNNVDNLYVQDIYGDGVSTIDVYENFDMSGHYIEGSTAYVFDSGDQLTASGGTLYFNGREVLVL